MSLRLLTLPLLALLTACQTDAPPPPGNDASPYPALADAVRATVARSWAAYETYAWPHDNLLPISKSHRDWYADPIFISPIDGYSTLAMMGLDAEAERIHRYVTDSLDFDRDISVKTFEVNIRVLGGLLAMFETTRDTAVLERAVDFADRMLPAFDSPTGLPYYYVNLRTGEPSGPVVNVAEVGTYVLEMGILSYYSQDPKYYAAAKRAIRALNERRSAIGLFGRDIDVETGEWTNPNSMVGAYADSYFEYLMKAWVLFGDPELKALWDENMAAVEQHVAHRRDSILWYPRVDMHTGATTETHITLWDAYFPGLLVLAGEVEDAADAFNGWEYVIDRYGLTPMVYDYAADSIVNPYHQLNPEVLESAYYLYGATGDEAYRRWGHAYYDRLIDATRTDVAHAHLADVRTGEQDDEMATFFIAETLKYAYLLFGGAPEVSPATHVFTTEAHPFAKENFSKERMGVLY